jgi:hypothetical protein
MVVKCASPTFQVTDGNSAYEGLNSQFRLREPGFEPKEAPADLVSGRHAEQVEVI